jgi:nucleotide-binding universal stress UspA family protein
MAGKVLCAVEPNEEARKVIETAAAVASAQSSTVEVLHVVKPLIHIYGDLNFTPLVEAEASIEAATREESLKTLESIAQEFGIDPANVNVRSGYPATEISRTAKDDKVDLVVIGVHNRTGLSRLLGSTTRAVINATSCSVLAVHPDHGSPTYDNLLVAVDTSKAMPEVFAHASSFTERASQTHVLSVVVPVGAAMAGMSPESFSSRWPLDDIQADILEKVRSSIATAMSDADLDKYELEVREGDPAEEIVGYAKSLSADLIVMGAGRRNILDRLLLGSTTHAVLNHAPCDIFVGR